jgi:hypothetical protein
MWDVDMGDVVDGVAGQVILGLLVAVFLVGVRRLLAQRVTRTAVERLDEMQAQVTTWQLGHSVRMRALGERMTQIERSTARAEDSARVAASAMRALRGDLLEGMDHVEQRIELETLVAEGRIPAEHLADCPRGSSRPRLSPCAPPHK